MEYVDSHGRPLFSFEGFERPPLLGWHEDYVFLQPQLELMLRRGLSTYRNVDVRLAWEASSIDTLLEEATYVVACDGGSSRIREALGITMSDLGYDEQWLVVDLMVQREVVPPLPTII